MQLMDAYNRLKHLSYIKFEQLFSTEEIETIIRNKGKTGQLLELALGMKLSSTNLDFDDGELKTNKCNIHGIPKETVFITQISNIIDELIEEAPFESTHLYEKISNILYVPVCKDDSPENWMFLPCIHINIKDRKFYNLKKIWEEDYYSICRQLKKHIETSPDGYIHTSSGKHLQIRSKDAKDSHGNYHPIYSSIYGRYISNKNHAFYFQKQFIYDIKQMNASNI